MKEKVAKPARALPLLDLTHFTLNALDLKKALEERDRARNVSVGGTVPKTVLELRRVTSLDLGNNMPPPWLSRLPHLRVLKIRAKALKTLPPVLFELPKLKELYLDDSGIQSLEGLDRAPALETVSLGRTALSKKADAIATIAKSIPGAKPSILLPGIDIGRKPSKAPKRKAELVRTLKADALHDETDLRGTDLSGAELEDLVIGQDLRKAKLANTVWRRCDFASSAQFAGADLTGAVFEDCYFDTGFASKNMEGVKAPGVTFLRCGGELVLKGADLRGARFIDLDPDPRLDLTKAKAEKLELRMTFSGEDDIEVKGAGADLRGARIGFDVTAERRRELARDKNPRIKWTTGQFRGAKTDKETRIVYAPLPGKGSTAKPLIDELGPASEVIGRIDSVNSLLWLLMVDGADAAGWTGAGADGTGGDFARAERVRNGSIAVGKAQGIICNVAESSGSSYIFRVDGGIVLIDHLRRGKMPEPKLKQALGLRVAQFPVTGARRIGRVTVKSGCLALLMPYEKGAFSAAELRAARGGTAAKNSGSGRALVPLANGDYDVLSDTFAPRNGYEDELGEYYGAIRIVRASK